MALSPVNLSADLQWKFCLKTGQEETVKFWLFGVFFYSMEKNINMIQLSLKSMENSYLRSRLTVARE